MKKIDNKANYRPGLYFGGADSPYISELGGFEWAASQPFALYPRQETTIPNNYEAAWARGVYSATTKRKSLTTTTDITRS
jgi:hypothetical protein